MENKAIVIDDVPVCRTSVAAILAGKGYTSFIYENATSVLNDFEGRKRLWGLLEPKPAPCRPEEIGLVVSDLDEIVMDFDRGPASTSPSNKYIPRRLSELARIQKAFPRAHFIIFDSLDSESYQSSGSYSNNENVVHSENEIIKQDLSFRTFVEHCLSEYLVDYTIIPKYDSNFVSGLQGLELAVESL